MNKPEYYTVDEAFVQRIERGELNGSTAQPIVAAREALKRFLQSEDPRMKEFGINVYIGYNHYASALINQTNIKSIKKIFAPSAGWVVSLEYVDGSSVGVSKREELAIVAACVRRKLMLQ